MPHYSDGTEAKVGDLVKGQPYNTPHEVTGVVVGVIPGSDSCNVRVAFAIPNAGPADDRVVAIKGYDDKSDTVQHVAVEVDYGETRAFTKIA